MPALANAPLIATAPNSGAGIVERAPPKLPIGVLTAATIYTSLFMDVDLIFSDTKLAKVQQIPVNIVLTCANPLFTKSSLLLP
jgi:hypothetical protein